MSAQRRAHSHVVARIPALDDALARQGIRSRREFARTLRGWDGAPGRATVTNLWQGHVIGIDKAEVIAAALETPVGDLFQLSNGRRIK